MNYQSLITRLRLSGVRFSTGLTEAEFQQIEAFFGIRFPKEIRSFFSHALPVGGSFFNWRDLSPANLQRFLHFYEDMEYSFRFDIAHNSFGPELGTPYDTISDTQSLHAAVMDYVRSSPRLVPFYGHRCFFDGMDNMPIISFWQPTDSVFYGGSFDNWLEVEFLNGQRTLEDIPDRMKNTGIWAHLID